MFKVCTSVADDDQQGLEEDPVPVMTLDIVNTQIMLFCNLSKNINSLPTFWRCVVVLSELSVVRKKS